MLETELKNNTAALAALAAAVADLTSALRAGNLSEIPNSSPAPVAPVAAPAPVAPAPVAPVAPAPVVAPVVPAVMAGDDLRKLCVKAGAAGLTAEVVQFLSDHGVTKLAALPPADYPALVALLNSKGVQ